MELLKGGDRRSGSGYYRKAVPIETSKMPVHKVIPEKAGLMLDEEGEIVDCLARYTDGQIKAKFGGKRAI